MDNRIMNKGTKGNAGGGRNSKEENQLIAERLTPLDDKAFDALKEGLENCESWAVKLFFSYRYGLPKQVIEQSNIDVVWNESKTYQS